MSASKSDGWPEFIVVSNGDETWHYGKFMSLSELAAVNCELSDESEVSPDLFNATGELNSMALRYRDALARNEELHALLRRRDEQIERLSEMLGI